MSVEANKQRIRELFAAWSGSDTSRWATFFHPDAVYHGLPYGFAPGLPGAVQYYEMSRRALPDLQFEHAYLIGEGNKVATRVYASGTHRGLFFGFLPTDRFARWTGTHIYAFRDEKIAEVWSIWDRLGFLTRVGILEEHPAVGTEIADAPASIADEPASPETVARNKAMVRRLVDEVLNQGRVEVADELLAPDFLPHPVLEGFGPGREGFKAFARRQLEIAPDHRLVIEDLLGEGNLVVLRDVAFSTPREPLIGFGKGKWRVLPMLVTYRIADGQIVERWLNADVLGTMAQLGEMPAFREKGS